MCQFRKNLISTTTVRPSLNNSKCESECLQNGKGVKKSEHNMKLNSLTVQVCDDRKVCRSQRKSVVTFATEKCREFSEKLPLINGIVKIVVQRYIKPYFEFNRKWIWFASFLRQFTNLEVMCNFLQKSEFNFVFCSTH